jgi:hypothetical protein
MNESDKMNNDILKNENWLLRCENQGLKRQIIELENKIAELQMQTCRKHNERKAGRKEYQDKDVIRRIYCMYAQVKSYQEIADKLNAEGITTNAGGAWAKSSVRFILNNESYVKKGVLSEKEYNLDFS